MAQCHRGFRVEHYTGVPWNQRRIGPKSARMSCRNGRILVMNFMVLRNGPGLEARNSSAGNGHTSHVDMHVMV